HTPRRFVVHPETGRIVTIETDHNAMTQEMKQIRKQQMAEQMIQSASEDEKPAIVKEAQEFVANDLPEARYGAPTCGEDTWSSLIRLIDPHSRTTIQRVPLEQNQAAI